MPESFKFKTESSRGKNPEKPADKGAELLKELALKNREKFLRGNPEKQKQQQETTWEGQGKFRDEKLAEKTPEYLKSVKNMQKRAGKERK